MAELQYVVVCDIITPNTKEIKNAAKAGVEMRCCNNTINYSGKADVTLTPKEQDAVRNITEVYAAFGIKIGPLIGVVSGEKTTRFDFAVDSDAVFPKIRKLRDDVSLFLSVPPVELLCPIEGKMAFGIVVPSR